MLMTASPLVLLLERRISDPAADTNKASAVSIEAVSIDGHIPTDTANSCSDSGTLCNEADGRSSVL
jgi:hypothetical protein